MNVSRTSIRTSKKRRALTVIELLAATTLAAMLMVAVLGVLQSITRGQKSLFRDQATEPWQSRFIEQLEWDLTNSHTIRTTENGVSLEGFAGRDFQSGLAVHGPTLITYTVVTERGQPCLVRRETHLDSLNLHNSAAEVLCVGAARLVIAHANEVETLNAESMQLQNMPDGPLPPQVVVAVYAADSSDAMIYHAFTLR